jgi:hypothetical protein
MQLPSLTASSQAYFLYCDHIDGAVEAWEDAGVLTVRQQQTVREIGEMLRSAVSNLRTAVSATRAAERTANRARARFHVRDVVLDQRVFALSDAVLNGPAGKSREHPIYRQIFRDQTANEITRVRMRDEPEVVVRLLDRLDAAADFEGKAQSRIHLQQALQKSLVARSALDAAEQAERKAADGELTARRLLRTVIEQLYSKLRAVFPGQNDFVESFFPPLEGGSGPGTDTLQGGGAAR